MSAKVGDLPFFYNAELYVYLVQALIISFLNAEMLRVCCVSSNNFKKENNCCFYNTDYLV